MKTIIISWLLIGSSLACQVPVFRYALERWRPDHYELKLSYTTLDKELEQKLIDISSEAAGAKGTYNLQLTLDHQDSLEQNSYALIPPLSMKSEKILSQGVLTKERLHELVSSPKRQEIIDHIISGDSAVWVMVRSGDEAKDAEAREMLESSLKLAKDEINLPEGVIGNDENALTDEDKENQLASSIPLKIAFSIVEIDPSDPNEQIFLDMFMAGQPVETYADRVVIAPVFGRGRSTGPTFADDLSTAKIVQACKYLCGPCACGIKEENPGFDLLFHADWEKRLSQSDLIKEKPLADLTGFPAGEEDGGGKPEPEAGLKHEVPLVKPVFSSTQIITFVVGLLVLISAVTMRILSNKKS